MYFVFVYCLFLVFSAGHSYESSLSKIKANTDDITQEEAVKALIHRLIGNRSNEFHIRVNSEIFKHDKDVFKIFKSDSSNIVEIEGSSGVAVAWGFHHYLKYYCHCHMSWNDNQLNLPSYFPHVQLEKVVNDRFRYYQNVCTPSYSFVWWDWADWEKHIDWMALNGINLALAFNGQEAIWAKVYKKLGMTKEEINEHFTGPAFHSWGRMGNIRGWGGPLSDMWLSDSVMLQKQILARMRSLGIIPVLPAFAGHVPRALKRLYPNVTFTLAERWNNFEDKYCCPYLLSPQEPLFQNIGSLFLEEMIKEFGTNHIYNCDTFNEMIPSTGDLNYLRRVGKSIYESMTTIDPDAIWMLQGWIFYNEIYFWTKRRAEAMLTSVPIGKMLVLDLMSELNPQFERLNSYFGQPFIWCMLHNFGGTSGMHGTATRVNENVFKARSAINTSMVGIGLTMEGINQNYVMYDLMMETGWREEPANLSQWFSDYASRRYGHYSNHSIKMWQLLKGSVYNYPRMTQEHGNYILLKSPTLQHTPDVWYDPRSVMEAWDEILLAVQSNPSLGLVKTFKYDVVDVTRQALQLKIDFLYQQVVKAFNQKNELYLSNATSTFLEVMQDLNKLLASNKWFLLGPWLESAKNKGHTAEEKQQYEENARNQITLWGPNGEIKDYACKQWAHLMTSYYIPRWEFFFKALITSVMDKRPFNQRRVSEAIFTKIEQPFTFGTEQYPTSETGDSVEISQMIHKKWRSLEANYVNTVCSFFTTCINHV